MNRKWKFLVNSLRQDCTRHFIARILQIWTSFTENYEMHPSRRATFLRQISRTSTKPISQMVLGKQKSLSRKKFKYPKLIRNASKTFASIRVSILFSGNVEGELLPFCVVTEPPKKCPYGNKMVQRRAEVMIPDHDRVMQISSPIGLNFRWCIGLEKRMGKILL